MNSGETTFKLTVEPAAAIPANTPVARDLNIGEVADSPALREIEALNDDSESRWRRKLVVANELTRSLVSFQANKSRAVYRWYKYKEAFSAGLVEHFLSRYRLSSGRLLDPFAGSGTALFASGALGMKAEGIELLPIGQTIIEKYLRWDHRSGRRQGKKLFDKGRILSFDEAITSKLTEIVADLGTAAVPEDLFFTTRSRADVVLHSGSCLEIMPTFKADAYDCILTSPPYCNRYDYTRTYALELALLGVDEAGLVKLRQEMLSCTVENREKDMLALNPKWDRALAAADKHPLLQRILSYLDSQRQLDLLNNNGIPRMVRGYFYEMACVIAECARVLRHGAPLIMVNDNVRYAGASIAVDIILSEMAEELGFTAENILVLPNGKGNSSQQMGAHGRDQLRKCVYLWRRR